MRHTTSLLTLIFLFLLIVIPMLSYAEAIDDSIEVAVLKGNWQEVLDIIDKDNSNNNDAINRFLKAHAYGVKNRNHESALLFDSINNRRDLDLWLKWTESLLQRHPLNPIALFLLGDAEFRAGKLDEAIERYTQSIKLKGDFALAFDARGIMYDEEGEYELAISDFNKAIEINPEYSSAYNNRGLAYGHKGEYTRAISDYNKAIEIDPKYDMAYDNRGTAFRHKGDFDQAISDYSKAIEIYPSNFAAYTNRGLVYAENKRQYEEAVLDFTKSIEINPNYADAYSNRGMMYMVYVGNREKACSDWKRACELGLCDNYMISKERGDCE